LKTWGSEMAEQQKTIIEWTDIQIQYPPVDYDDNEEDDYENCEAVSVVVLIASDCDIDWGRYIYKNDGENVWVDATLGWGYFYGKKYKYWCHPDGLCYPTDKTEITNKKYTLKQLRQAWGKGVHDGKMGKY